jgi:hypothetical protein
VNRLISHLLYQKINMDICNVKHVIARESRLLRQDAIASAMPAAPTRNDCFFKRKQ